MKTGMVKCNVKTVKHGSIHGQIGIKKDAVITTGHNENNNNV